MWSWTLLSGVQGQDKTKQTQTEIQEIPFSHKKNLFHSKHGQTLKHLDQGGCGVSILGGTQNSTGQGPK